MTNREKFVEVLKETFGEDKIDYVEAIIHARDCEMLKCDAYRCSECPFYNFWKREYKGKEEGGNGK